MFNNCRLLLLLQLLSIISDSEAYQRFLRIVNGKSVEISVAPWQISLQDDGSHSCGGSILSSKLIVTAAHCVNSFKAKELKVRAGSSMWNTGGQVIQVASIKIHPKFETNTYSHDIATLRLKRSLKLGRNVKIIRLATTAPKNGSKVSVTGWGDTGRGVEKLPKRLQKVNLRGVDRKTCQKAYKFLKKRIIESMVCAIGHNKDACQGDSGGPLVANGKLVGIVSFGIGCALDGIPGIYTNVAYFNKWLKNELKKC